MNLGITDISIIAAVIVGTYCIAIYFKRFNRGVTDFLAASRLAGPYILTMAPSLCGATAFVALTEATYNNGISSGWWQKIGLPVSIILTLCGFVHYRLRQTKALTLSQFLEARYSRKFRLFAGTLCWVSGALNYAIMPMVAARAFICFFGLPVSFEFLGFEWQTFPVLLFCVLFTGCFVACCSGQGGIIVTGFFQNFISIIAFLLVAYFIIYKFNWDTIIRGLRVVSDPDKKSLTNPFKAFDADGFNIWYYVILIFFNAYSRGCWQGGAGIHAAAKTPHDLVMSGVFVRWRSYGMFLATLLIPLAAYAAFHLPEYISLVAPLQAKLDTVADTTIQNQMRVPLFISAILPTGLLGLFVAGIVGSTVSVDASYLHSWGTIFVQDVVMPFRKKPFNPRRHLLYLRLGIIGVAVFSFFFSLFFPLKDFVNMYFMITGAIYMGGAGAVVIGGLYWKRGSTPAAWTALILGTIFCCTGLTFQSFWNHIAPFFLQYFPECTFFQAPKFPIPSPILTLFTMLISVGSYVLISLFGPKHVHNMDKLLHRGEYAEADTREKTATTKISVWKKLCGISPQHTGFERFLMYASFSIPMLEWFVFVIVTILALFTNLLTDRFWEQIGFWKTIPMYFIFGTICTIWLSCGGIRDVINLVKDLRTTEVNEKDDGFVE